MGFRDDREASAQRMEALERDLASTKDELEAASLRALEVDDLRKRVVTLTAERDALQGGVDPRWRERARRLGIACAVLALATTTIGAIAYTSSQRAATEQAQAAHLAELSLDASHDQLAQLRETLDEARTIASAHESAADAEIARLRRSIDAHDTPALVVTASIATHEGILPPFERTDCALVFRDGDGSSCIAALSCGGTQLYPLPDARPSAPVACLREDGTPWRANGTDDLARARTSSEGDWPMIFYDARLRTIDLRGPAAGAFALHLRAGDVFRLHL